MHNTLEAIKTEIELSGGTLEGAIENTAYVLQMRVKGGYGVGEELKMLSDLFNYGTVTESSAVSDERQQLGE